MRLTWLANRSQTLVYDTPRQCAPLLGPLWFNGGETERTHRRNRPSGGKAPAAFRFSRPCALGAFWSFCETGQGHWRRPSGSPRENRRRVLYFAVAKRHRGDTCLAVYFSTQEPRLKGACPQRFLVCAFCAAMAFDVWRRRVGAFHLAALSNGVLSYSHRHCFFGPDSNLLRFPSRRQLPL